jgi:ring-1,2-phenylacetyl-CoA epoxidase subunit PaaD
MVNMNDTNTILSNTHIWQLLASVPDPEVPVLSVVDLGIVRSVFWEKDLLVVVTTPTYSGCPAINAINTAIKFTLLAAGYTLIEIREQLHPAWTTDWITESGKQKLQEYGIAPPYGKTSILPEDGIPCPRCYSTDTLVISPFGSTACKALYKCNHCKEPFDYFKCH